MHASAIKGLSIVTGEGSWNTIFGCEYCWYSMEPDGGDCGVCVVGKM